MRAFCWELILNEHIDYLIYYALVRIYIYITGQIRSENLIMQQRGQVQCIPVLCMLIT